jgi:hypothetical protein
VLTCTIYLYMCEADSKYITKQNIQSMLCVPIIYLSHTPSSVIQKLFPAVICFFLFINALTVGPVKYVYVAEVFPSDLKTKAVQLVLFSEIVVSIVASYSLYMISELGLTISFSILSVIGFLASFIIKVFALETLNKTFYEIDHSFVLSKNNKYFPVGCCRSSSSSFESGEIDAM